MGWPFQSAGRGFSVTSQPLLCKSKQTTSNTNQAAHHGLLPDADTKPSQRAMANSLASRGAWFPSRWEGAWRWPSAGARAPITSRVAVKESSRAWRWRGHARRNARGEEQRSVVCGSLEGSEGVLPRDRADGQRRGDDGVPLRRRSPRRRSLCVAATDRRAGCTHRENSRGDICGIQYVALEDDGLRRVRSSAGTGLTEEGRRRVGAICKGAYGHLEIARTRGYYFVGHYLGRVKAPLVEDARAISSTAFCGAGIPVCGYGSPDHNE